MLPTSRDCSSFVTVICLVIYRQNMPNIEATRHTALHGLHSGNVCTEMKSLELHLLENCDGRSEAVKQDCVVNSDINTTWWSYAR